MAAYRIDLGADRKSISDTIVKFLGDKGIFLHTRIVYNPKKLKAFDGLIVESKGIAQINPLMQTVSGPCRIRDIKFKIMKGNDTCIGPGNACVGRTVLENTFFIASGSNLMDFIGNDIDRLASIDYGDLAEEYSTAKLRKSG